MKTAYFKYYENKMPLNCFRVVLMVNGKIKDNYIVRSKEKAEAICSAWTN